MLYESPISTTVLCTPKPDLVKSNTRQVLKTDTTVCFVAAESRGFTQRGRLKYEQLKYLAETERIHA